MKNKKLFWSLFGLIAIMIIFVLTKDVLKRPTRQLNKVEIRAYQGENLSSVNDFKENSIKGPQFIDKQKYVLKIKGLQGGEVAYNYNEIISNHQMYKKVVKLNCIEGWSVNILWEGFLVRDLIDSQKIPVTAKTIIFRAVDGYSTSFPVNYIFDKDILMAYKQNGLVLAPERGFPFQLVAEDKFGYKWIKWITEIEFSGDANYQGYWESRGYSNEGNLKK